MEENNVKNNTIVHKDNSLNRLDLSFLKHIELEEYKTSNLLAYWISDFANYHDNERTFDCSKSGVFSRGDVIKVNLGFNIGNELGGLHYCIVLNKNDNPKVGTLNVIPLTSKKPNKKYPNVCVNLGSELYNIIDGKIESETIKLNKMLAKLDEIEGNIPRNIQNAISNEMKYIDKLGNNIHKTKKESIALINQITTISKQRIYNDFILKNVKISNKSLDLIDKNIIRFFTK